ncbi:uncharacterized protein Z519_10390 [Cladophialophora bantiana CBS 173.52]|uniref:Uncharacterized protein n=1 Tax=Cladophialophora bantiana (strain ATCC 10958 / CBS 173.52 / CDC B-1940 / NIH 8579) TaxID=1442370 RepID=A0A0D2EFS9_CLAB1|nr:uncharacterized protein Z519_10390 [Cladophialophora bantiana CBS 173.52]KIW88906.1 hypothetical protein Z519_10390 [Cladophialophora bantiana CBS 173.52]
MVSIFTFLTFIALLSSAASAFSGNFELTNVVVSSPFQADPTSTQGSYLQFDFCDQDTPEVGATHCCVDWAVGLGPPTSASNTCDNSTFDVLITSWHGVGNLSLRLAHQYIDNSVGQAPYNVLTKFSDFNLTYPATEHYQCDMGNAECVTSAGEVIIANVTTAIA